MSKEAVKEKLRRLESPRAVFGILLIVWIPWAVLCFPGNILYDAGTSIAWFLNLNRSNVNNPWFQNLLMGVFYRIGDLTGIPPLGVYLYCCGQMVLEAWILSRLIPYLAERAGAGKGAYFLIPLYGLLPVFPIYAVMMGKDSNFGVALLAAVYLLIRAATEREAFWSRPRNYWILAALPAVLGLLRNHGGWIPLAVFAVLVLKAKKKAGILPAAVSALAVVSAAVLIPAAAGIPAGEMKEEMSIPLQSTACYAMAHPEEVTEEEWNVITKAVDREILLGAYNPMIADPVKDRSVFTAETRGEFLRMWLGLLRKHPGTILRGWWDSVHLYFSLTECSPVKSHVFFGVNMEPELQEQLRLYSWEGGNYIAKGAWHVSMMVPGIRVLQRIGLYSWLTLGMTAAALCFRKIRKYLPCCLLLLMVLGACLLSPVNGYYRYAFSMILSVPAVLAAVLGAVRRHRKDPDSM